jgi:hypothetical protein
MLCNIVSMLRITRWHRRQPMRLLRYYMRQRQTLDSASPSTSSISAVRLRSMVASPKPRHLRFDFCVALCALKQRDVPSHQQPAVGEANRHPLAFRALNNLPGLALKVHLVLPKWRFGNESDPIAYFGTSVGWRFALFHCCSSHRCVVNLACHRV